ncbi:MAG: amidohydrolase [Flavobacteriales bacterium]|nr:amidohydrolase [Flavobacteriales bacterium]
MRSRYIMAVGLLFLSACNFKSKQADLIIHNANIYTADVGFTTASAVAIVDGKIVAVGAERAIMNFYRADEYIDCQKQYVYPGFNDAHCHFVRYGTGLLDVDLVGTKSWDECIERVKTHREKYPDQEWIKGWGWDQNDWEVKEWPNRELLDELFPNVPMSLERIDGHATVINEKAMEIAGVDRSSHYDGGEILKDEKGEVTGLLIDNAMEYIRSVIPEARGEELDKGILAAQKNCLAVGLTSITEAGLPPYKINAIKELQGSGELKMRVNAMLDPIEESMEWIRKGPYQDARLSVRSIKLYGDGALGSRGALLKRPYSDDHGNHGLMREDPTFYRKWAEIAIKHEFQLNTHCIGDRGNEFILDLYKDLLKGTNDRRWRIEHAQVVDLKDMHLFKDHSIIPSVQPTHATSDMYWAETRLGKERMEGAYSYNSLMGQNGFIPLGTDFPIEGIDPLNTFYSAVFRQDKEGFPEGGFRIEEALSRQDALKGMTIWPALACFEDTLKGSIELGKFADFTVLDVDLMEASPELIKKAKVVRTIIGGETVYRRN